MHLFGYTLWTELFTGDARWIRSLGLDDRGEFDPEGTSWDGIFVGLASVLDRAGLAGKMGGCLHVSSEIAAMCSNTGTFEILPRYLAARDAFATRTPFELGVHRAFNDTVNPLGPEHATSFLADLRSAKTLQATTLVAHPPRNFSYDHGEMERFFIDDVTRPELCEALAGTGIIIAWENMIEGQYSSLQELLVFRERLADRLNQIGFPELANQHRICLDTGHLLIWRAHHPSTRHADAEIESCLPGIAKHLKVYHIHANDGSSDFHVTPGSTAFLDHETRKGMDPAAFMTCSGLVSEWIESCEVKAKLDRRHVHLEADKVPFSLDQYVQYARSLP